ncbi:MAG: transketolase [Candidatus Babeliaceae bacterium]
MNEKIAFLERKAYNMRVNCLRATTQAGSGHATSCLSAADIVSVLFFYAMHYDSRNFWDPNNDRFILSKGHAAPLLYAAWKEVGVISEEELLTLRQFNSRLEGHPTPRFPYVDVATGSLGQGLSIGLGESLTARLDKRSFYTYVLMGDSEVAEGSVWEAAEIAAFYQCDNLIAFIDVNRLGQSTQTMEGYHLEKYRAQFEAFGWKAWLIDGHDISSIMQACDQARQVRGQPTIIIAKTYKGYGLDANIENENGFHGKAFSKEQLPFLLEQLKKRFPQATAYHEKSAEKIITPQKDAPLHHFVRTSIPFIPAPYKQDEEIATRKAFGEVLAALGKYDENIISLDAEVKNSTYAEIFEKAFPERFFQCFIAEQNMVSMAVGFVARGKIPFVSTFSCFLTRAHDQIRMAAIGRSPLRIVGSHAGVSIGEDGPSQMGLEDIALMRTLPESIVLHPCDAVSTFYLMQLMVQYDTGISYLRTLREKTAVIYDTQSSFSIGGYTVLRESKQDSACVIGAGSTVFEALKAYETLKQENIFIRVIDCYSIKPLAVEKIYEAITASNKKAIIVEDHYRAGGLGDAVIEPLCNNGFHFTHLAVDQLPRSGKPEELRAFEQIDAAAIIRAIKHLDRTFF